MFCIGAGGVLTAATRWSILLCLELMLNAANLALIAFSRMHGNGDGADLRDHRHGRRRLRGHRRPRRHRRHVPRRRLPIDVDELRTLQG